MKDSSPRTSLHRLTKLIWRNVCLYMFRGFIIPLPRRLVYKYAKGPSLNISDTHLDSMPPPPYVRGLTLCPVLFLMIVQ